MANLPYIAATATVTSTPALLCSPTGASHVYVFNGSGGAIFLGGPNVTAAGATQGIPLAVSTGVLLPAAGDSAHDLWAVAASTSSSVSYLFPE